MSLIYFLFRQTLYFAIPLMIVALAGMFSERSGVVNIALEGIMIFGAFFGVYFIHIMQLNGTMSGMTLLFCALLVAGFVGGIFGLLHAFASVTLKADQTISGTALNMLAPAFGLFFAKTTLDGVSQVLFTNEFRITAVPGLSSIPVIGDLFFKNCYVTTLLGVIILVGSWFVMYKTKFGLRIRACGENPSAADAAGINVYRTRYISVIISGILGGIGGLIYVIPIATEFESDVAGYGFLAMAVLIFGNWKPWRIAGAAFFFGLMKTLSYSYTSIGFLNALNMPGVVYKLIPYVATLIVLVVTSKDSQGPRASGVPYDKSSR
ncbi:MAG: ABC transporter permease [Erysipelotrichaceae bacterium]|nr:ABC transporter permease [Erysipelotrichaceae bacterium]